MHLGETFMALGALILFAFASLNINAAKLDNESGMLESEFMITATGIAQSYIHSAKGLSFDEVTVDESFSGSIPDSFTLPAGLGPESGESYPLLDDVDDLNGYTAAVNTPRADYTVEINIQYTDTLNLALQTAERTPFKLMNVTVYSIYMKDTVRCSHLFGFHD